MLDGDAAGDCKGWCSAQRIKIGRLPVASAPLFLHLPVAPLYSSSFGTFLAETRKVRSVHRIEKSQFIAFCKKELPDEKFVREYIV